MKLARYDWSVAVSNSAVVTKLPSESLRLSRWAVSKTDCLLILFVMATTPLTLQSQTSSSTAETSVNVPDLTLILQSLAEASQRDSGRLRPRTVTREYKVFRHDNNQPVSQVTAEIRFVAHGESTYKITHSSGGTRGEKVIRKILDSETQPGKKERYSEISDRNYEFAFLRQENLDGHAMYILRLIPKKKEKGLLRGLIWVDAKTFRIWRIEGAPTRKPSWWIKTLDIRLQFTEVNGMWLHTSLEVTAFVRIFGKYVLSGRDIGLQTTATSAKDHAPVDGDGNVSASRKGCYSALRFAALENKNSILTRSPRSLISLAMSAFFTYLANSSLLMSPLSFSTWTMAPI
jgi:hypothetical protein